MDSLFRSKNEGGVEHAVIPLRVHSLPVLVTVTALLSVKVVASVLTRTQNF